MPDGQLAGYVAGLRTREQLLADCEVILLPKPLPQDLGQMREGQVLWGWPHCIQNEEITQLGVDLRLTLIAFEAMNHWHDDRSFGLHVFHQTTNSPATARCCTPCSSSGPPVNTAARFVRVSSVSVRPAGARSLL